MPFSASWRAGLDGELDLGAGGDQDHVGRAALGVEQDVAAAVRRRRWSAKPVASPRGKTGTFCRVSARPAGRSVCSRMVCQAATVSLASAGPDDVEAGDGAQRGEVLDRLVGRAVLAEADRVVGPDVGDRELHERGEPDRRAHVVGEHQEGAAVDAGAAVQGDAVHDRAHGVLADAEVQHPAVAGRPGTVLGGELRRARTTARPSGSCCWTRRGRPSRPTARAAPARSR